MHVDPSDELFDDHAKQGNHTSGLDTLNSNLDNIARQGLLKRIAKHAPQIAMLSFFGFGFMGFVIFAAIGVVTALGWMSGAG